MPMLPGETPDDYRLRLGREAQQRFRDRKAAEARGETPPPLKKVGRPKYSPKEHGGVPFKEHKRKRENEATARYRETDLGQEAIERYNRGDTHKESNRRYSAKPEVKAEHAKRMRERRAYERHVKETEGKREPEVIQSPFVPGGDAEAARINRDRIAAEKGKNMPQGPQLHPWWRKIGRQKPR